MLDVAELAVADDPVDEAEDTEPRPVRLLVPTERLNDWYLSPEDTLRASDFGITRHTTDDQLAAIVDTWPDATEKTCRRLRDGLRHPRDIAEARDWGFEVPVTAYENSEEFSDDPTKRLGWWWVYDLTRTETREQREARYLADERPVDVKGAARLYCRSYVTTRDLNVATKNARKYIRNEPGARQKAIEKYLRKYPDTPLDGLEEYLLIEARRTEFLGTPPRTGYAGQSDLFTVAAIMAKARQAKRLNEWYQWVKVKQTGRPRGSRTKRKTAPAS